MVLTFFLGLQLLPISEVTRVSWWMAHYGGLSPKRHYAWSNSPAIKRLDKGRLQWKKLKATLPYTIETVKKYVDSENRTRYHGTGELRSTEWLGYKDWCILMKNATKVQFCTLCFCMPFSYGIRLPVWGSTQCALPANWWICGQSWYPTSLVHPTPLIGCQQLWKLFPLCLMIALTNGHIPI